MQCGCGTGAWSPRSALQAIKNCSCKPSPSAHVSGHRWRNCSFIRNLPCSPRHGWIGLETALLTCITALTLFAPITRFARYRDFQTFRGAALCANPIPGQRTRFRYPTDADHILLSNAFPTRISFYGITKILNARLIRLCAEIFSK